MSDDNNKTAIDPQECVQVLMTTVETVAHCFRMLQTAQQHKKNAQGFFGESSSQKTGEENCKLLQEALEKVTEVQRKYMQEHHLGTLEEPSPAKLNVIN